jgi:predicted nucleic acid-binding Zn ribbon protein
MKTRPSFECCQCGRSFGQVVDLEGKPVLALECPYCGAECKADLAPYRQPIIAVLKGEGAASGETSYELPDPVPTFKAEDGESGQETQP